MSVEASQFDEDIGIENLNLRFSVDELSSFRDLTQLASAALKKIRENIQSVVPAFYIHDTGSHDFHEMAVEGLFGFPEDSLFISFLAMKNDLISVADLKDEIVLENDDLLRVMLINTLRVTYILPITYNYNLLGFITFSFDDEDCRDFSSTEKAFINLLCENLRVNLYAATLIDNRLKELTNLTSFSDELRSLPTYEKLTASLMQMVKKVIPFECGIYYEFDDLSDLLLACSVYGIERPETCIPAGKGICGYVLRKQKPVLVNSLKDNIFFRELCTESFVRNSFISVPVMSGNKVLGILLVTNGQDSGFSVDNLYILRIMASMVGNEMDNKRLYRKLQQSYLETISTLSRALEAKDKYTQGHSERVMKYSAGIAKELNFTDEHINDLKTAALLHDIGKIGIAENILNKPDRLTPGEYNIIQNHPNIGADILASIDFLGDVKDFIRYHHEKLNGEGYYGKKSGEYPWESTIICLADIFDALTSQRPYRKVSGPSDAVRYLYQHIGEYFDKPVFDAFLRFLKKSGITPQEFDPAQSGPLCI